MPLPTLLRFLICGEILFSILGVVADLLFEHRLPPELRVYQENIPFPEGYSFYLLLAFLVIEILLLIVSWIGLWRLWNPARWLYLISLTVAHVVALFSPPFIGAPLADLLFSLASYCTGGIFVLIFFTDLRRSFRKKSSSSADLT